MFKELCTLQQCIFDFAQFWYGFTKRGRVEQVLSNKCPLSMHTSNSLCLLWLSVCYTGWYVLVLQSRAHFRCFDTHWAADYYNRRSTRKRWRLHAKAKTRQKVAPAPTSLWLDSHSTGKPQVLWSASMLYCYLVSKLLIVSIIIQVLIIIATSVAWIIKVQKKEHFPEVQQHTKWYYCKVWYDLFCVRTLLCNDTIQGRSNCTFIVSWYINLISSCNFI